MKKISDIIFALSAIVGFISFIVMIVGWFIHPSAIGFFAMYLFCICFIICLIIGIPKDEGKGIFARGRNLG